MEKLKNSQWCVETRLALPVCMNESSKGSFHFLILVIELLLALGLTVYSVLSNAINNVILEIQPTKVNAKNALWDEPFNK